LGHEDLGLLALNLHFAVAAGMTAAVLQLHGENEGNGGEEVKYPFKSRRASPRVGCDEDGFLVLRLSHVDLLFLVPIFFSISFRG
jgi:hypothetical protein